MRDPASRVSDDRDRKVSSYWAIASVGSLGAGLKAGVTTIVFDLVNLTGGRAHRVDFVGFGATASPLPVSVSISKISYSEFTTPRPVSFVDFDAAKAYVTSYGVIAYGGVWLTVFDKAATFRQLAKVYNGGWGFYLPDGDMLVGVLELRYGQGKPKGPVGYRLEINDPVTAKSPRQVHVETTPREEPKTIIIDDALFDFDSARLKSEVRRQLLPAMRALMSRKSWQVIIEGHTDSIGRPEYNRDLSYKRAWAVKDFFIRNHIAGAEMFEVRPLGESRPVAPNQNPDGSDNPEGRRKNRRVEIKYR